MKKILPFLIVILAMVFTACSPATQASTTPGAGIETLETEVMSTEPMSTEAVSTETMATEPASTEPAGTGPVVTETPASTEVLPVTGEIDPGRMTAMLDFEVYDQSNQQVGKVSDIVLDLGTVKIAYVLVDTTGSGSGSMIAVPYAALSVGAGDSGSTNSQQQDTFVLTVDREVFDGAPAFDVSTIPDLGSDSTGWDQELKTYWDSYLTGETASQTTSTSGNTGVVLASDLLALSMNIGAAENALSVKVNDVLVDPATGDLLYVVVDYSDEAGNQKLIPVPFRLFQWDETTGAYTLKVTPDVLAGAPSFSMDQYPSTLEANWDAEFESYWQSY